MQVFAFYLFATFVIASGAFCIFARNPVHSVLWLIFAFFNAAGLMLRSEEHTSELQSRSDLVCRLLLEKKKHNPVEYIINGMDRIKLQYIHVS